MAETNGTDAKTGGVRVAAVGDVHCTAGSAGQLQPLLSQMVAAADVLALCGDLTNLGLPDEARVLVKELHAATANAPTKLPIVAVLGNHDFESGHGEEVRQILVDGGLTLLDGDAVELHGVGFAGVKGFAGGFGRGTLSSFGEAGVKAFVQEAIDEAMKLEKALQRLRTPHRVAVLHYSPIRETVEGEPVEIFPFLGCSRLEEPINRYRVDACIHGHAHRGALEGKTSAGVPVYNVALPLMQASYPNQPPFRLLHFETAQPAATSKQDASTPRAPVQTTVA